MSTIDFPVAARYLDLPLSRGYKFKECIFFFERVCEFSCNNNSQTAIITELEDELLEQF